MPDSPPTQCRRHITVGKALFFCVRELDHEDDDHVFHVDEKDLVDHEAVLAAHTEAGQHLQNLIPHVPRCSDDYGECCGCGEVTGTQYHDCPYSLALQWFEKMIIGV